MLPVTWTRGIRSRKEGSCPRERILQPAGLLQREDAHMKKSLSLLGCVAVLAIACWGCKQETKQAASVEPASATSTAEGEEHGDHEHPEVMLCGLCGQIKGSADCCKEGAEKCEKCSLVKGSPGCCIMTAGQDVTLCAHCGQIKGSADCCKEGAEKCEKCGLAKGSPGCCKMPAPTKT